MFTQFNWPPQDFSAVCSLQSLDGSLTLDGSLSKSDNTEVSFISHGFSRSIVIQGTSDLNNVRFYVEGTQNGKPIGEQIVATQATVYSQLCYDTITSITTNSEAGNIGVTVGTGNKGYLPLLNLTECRWEIVDFSHHDNSPILQYKGYVISKGYKLVNNGHTYDELREKGCTGPFKLGVVGSSTFSQFYLNNGLAESEYLLIYIVASPEDDFTFAAKGES